MVISETHIFTPRTVNELRLGYSRNRSERLQFNANENLSAQFGIPGIPFSTNNGGLPQFSVTGLNSFRQLRVSAHGRIAEGLPHRRQPDA